MTPDDQRLEDALRSVGDAYLRRNPADLPAARAKLRRLHQRRRLKTGAMTALAGAAAVAVALYVWPSPDDVTQRGLPPAAPLVASQVEIEVDGGPTEVAVGDDAIWVSSETGTVSRIDPATDEVVAEVAMTAAPGDIAVSDGAVWVTIPELGAVSRINPASDSRTPDELIDVAAPGSSLDLAIDQYLWVSVVGEELVQLDATTGEEVRRITDVTPVNVAARAGRVFVLEDDGTVVELDATTGARTGFERAFDVFERGDVHFYGERLWVASSNGNKLFAADVSSADAPIETFTFPGTYQEMVLTASQVFVLSDPGDGTGILSAVTASGSEPVAGVELEGGPRDLVQGAGSLWVSNYDADTVTRIEAVAGVRE